MIRAPIETSLSTKNRRFSNIFSNTSTVPQAWVATATAIDVRSAGNAGQGPSSIFGTWSPRSFWITSSWCGGTRSQSSPSSTSMPKRLNAVDSEVAVRDGCEADQAADLDVLGSDGPLPSRQPLDPVDAEDVRLDALDPGAERDEEAAEILHVRLAGGVSDRGLAGRDDGRHDRVLGRHHARLVEEDAGAAQPLRPHL